MCNVVPDFFRPAGTTADGVLNPGFSSTTASTAFIGSYFRNNNYDGLYTSGALLYQNPSTSTANLSLGDCDTKCQWCEKPGNVSIYNETMTGFTISWESQPDVISNTTTNGLDPLMPTHYMLRVVDAVNTGVVAHSQSTAINAVGFSSNFNAQTTTAATNLQFEVDVDLSSYGFPGATFDVHLQTMCAINQHGTAHDVVSPGPNSLELSAGGQFTTYVGAFVGQVTTLASLSQVNGCTDATACNENTLATPGNPTALSDCTYADPNEDCAGNCLPGFVSINSAACTTCNYGCIDPLYNEYSTAATCSDQTQCLTLITTLSIGDTHQGGIIFYLDGNGGGLIAAPTDQSTGVLWGCYGTAITGADGTVIGTGNQNTIDIIAECTTTGIAAEICANLTLNGYSDWFLPSKNELNKMYLNIGQGNALGLGNIGGFATGILSSGYWSSTQRNANTNEAWALFFDNGLPINYTKWNSMIVRAVRSF